MIFPVAPVQQTSDVEALRAAVANLERAIQPDGDGSQEGWQRVADVVAKMTPAGTGDLHLDKVVAKAYPSTGSPDTEPEFRFAEQRPPHVRGRKHAELWIASCGHTRSLWLVDSGGSRTYIAVLYYGNDDSRYPRQVDAYATGSKLWIVGVFDDIINSPFNGLSLYEDHGAIGWQTIQNILTEGEAKERPRIHYTNGRPDLKAFSSVSRPYPNALSACHACPHVLQRDVWTWDDGQYLIRQEFIDTPLLALDRVFTSIEIGDWQGALKFLARPQLLEPLKRAWGERGEYGLRALGIDSTADYDYSRVYYVVQEDADAGLRCTFAKSGGHWKVSGVTYGTWDTGSQKFTPAGKR